MKLKLFYYYYLYTFLDYGIPHTNHMLGQIFNQWQKTTFGIKPSICTQLFVVRFQRFDYSWNSKFIIALGTIQGSNDQINNTKMKNFFVLKLISNFDFTSLYSKKKKNSVKLPDLHKQVVLPLFQFFALILLLPRKIKISIL